MAGESGFDTDTRRAAREDQGFDRAGFQDPVEVSFVEAAEAALVQDHIPARWGKLGHDVGVPGTTARMPELSIPPSAKSPPSDPKSFCISTTMIAAWARSTVIAWGRAFTISGPPNRAMVRPLHRLGPKQRLSSSLRGNNAARTPCSGRIFSANSMGIGQIMSHPTQDWPSGIETDEARCAIIRK